MCTEQNAHDQALHVALEHVPCVEPLGEAVPEVESDIRKIVVGMGAAMEHNVEVERGKWGWEGGPETILIRKLSPSSVNTLK